MLSVRRPHRTAHLLFLAYVALVGILGLQVLNSCKPVFLAEELSEDEVSAASSARIFFGVIVAYDIKEVVKGIMKDVVLTSSREYPHYASRHGANPDQSWTLHAMFVTDDDNVTIGEVWVQWDGVMYEMSVYGSRPYSMLYPHYEVTIARTAVMTFKSDWENQDFQAASVHFLEFTESGDLVWRQEDWCAHTCGGRCNRER